MEVCENSAQEEKAKESNEAIKMTTSDLESNSDDKSANLGSSLVHPESEESPESRVFRNQVIIIELFRHLPKTDYQKFRHINRHWLVAWAGSIPVQNDICLEFRLNSGTQQYENRHGTLNDLTCCLQNCIKFPCTNFKFSGGHLHTPDVSPFLQLHGHFIKTLTLDLSGQQQPSQISRTTLPLRQFLLDVAPSLEHLIIDKLDILNSAETEDNLPDFVFPKFMKLTKIKIVLYNIGNEEVKRFVLQILASAPNLQEIDGLGDNWQDEMVKMGKMHAIKSLELLLNGNRLERYESFANFGCQLKIIHFNCIRLATSSNLYPRIKAMVTKILDSSTATMEKMEWVDELAFLPEFGLPKFEKVTSLILRCRLPPQVSRLMPAGSNFSQTFPNLVTLDVSCPLNVNLWRHDPAFSDPLMSVENLTLRSNSTSTGLSQIARIFPNVKRLYVSIRNLNECPIIFRETWSLFVKIEEFTLNTDDDASGEPMKKCCAKMDNAITGIGVDICHDLAKNLTNNVPFQEVTNLRDGPSILDAKYLKQFKFSVRRSEETFTAGTIFSHVAGLYGFQPMRERQGLSVTLETKGWTKKGDATESAAFGLVTSYVDSVSWSY